MAGSVKWTLRLRTSEFNPQAGCRVYIKKYKEIRELVIPEWSRIPANKYWRERLEEVYGPEGFHRKEGGA